MKKVSMVSIKKKYKQFFAIVTTCLFIFVLSFFIKAVKYRKVYDNSKTYYRIFHYTHKTVKEDPIEIVSQFREDDNKRGILSDKLNFKGQIKHLFGKINGSLHNASKATPAVDESGVYVASDVGWFYKLDHDGNLIWKTYLAKTAQGVHGTALLSKKYLWVGAYSGVLYCLEKQTGDIVWAIHLGDAIGASPSFYKGQIIVSVELVFPRYMGYVASVSAKDGSLNWKMPLTSAHIHSSVAIHTEKGYGVTGANNGFLFKIDLNSGRILWNLQMKGDIKSTPLIYKDRIYVSNWGNQFAAVSEDGKILWSKNIRSASQSSPTLIPDKEYLVFATHRKGQLFSVSAKDGALIWEKKIDNNNALSSGVSFFSKRDKKYLFLFPCETTAICFIDPVNGNILQKIQTGFLLTGSFGYFNNRLYISFNNGGVSVLY